jgi:hypothetical protein
MYELDFTTSFQGVTPSGVGFDIPDCPIKAKITKIDVVDNRAGAGAKNAIFYLAVTEPGYVGAQRRLTMRVPDQTEQGQNARSFWRAALESVGYAASAIDNGPLTIRASNFVGKEGHFWHTKGSGAVVGKKADGSDAHEADKVQFITPVEYANRKAGVATAAANESRQPEARVTGPATVQPNNGSSGPIDTQSLRATLL